jgi:beta-glucanase (GH16 family)
MARFVRLKSHKALKKHSLKFIFMRKKIKKDNNSGQFSLLVLIAIIIGLLLTATQLVKVSDVTPIVQSTTIKQSAVSVQPSLPTQKDARFTSQPAWSQNFATETSGLLNQKSWNVSVGPAINSNNEQEYYTDNLSNLQIASGALSLTGTHEAEPQGYQYGSARIDTQNKQSFLYGRLDITAKLPNGVGTWPAIWMLSSNNLYDDKSPSTDSLRYKNGGEIDILEAVGFLPNSIYGVAHTASDLSLHPGGTGSYSVATVPNSSTAFNTYTLLWTPTSLTFAINGVSYYTYARPANADYTTWPFDQPFYLIANLALGGSWGGMDTKQYPGNGIDNSALPASLQIRSIYYYPYIST